MVALDSALRRTGNEELPNGPVPRTYPDETMTTLILNEAERDLIERLLAGAAIERTEQRAPSLDALTAIPLLERLQGTPRVMAI